MAVRSSRSNDGARIRRGFFEPRSLAVIGASTNAAKVGYSVLANIIKSDYPGNVYPVNPKAEQVQGRQCYPDVRSLPETVDLAIIIVPAAAVPDTITDCVAMGVPAAVIVSAGFREVGIEGRRLERLIVERAREGDMRLLGPNCLGVINTAVPMNASFARRMPPIGSIGVVSQSGAICTSLIDWARAEGVGFSKLISLGNSADLVESDFLEALAADEETSVICMYLEGVSDGDRFLSSLTAASKKKPVVLFKSGTTQAGAQAASSHTGTLAGSESAYSAACKQSGAMRAATVGELVELSRVFATGRAVPTGPRVAILTNAGGPGIIASDACDRAGLVLASISGASQKQLSRYLPAAASLHNPVDVLGDADAMRYAISCEALLADPAVDAVVVILTPQAMTEIYRTADELIRIAGKYPKAMVCSFMGAGSVEDAIDKLQAAGIPNVPYPDQAMLVLGRMYDRYLTQRRPPSKPLKFQVDRTAVARLFANYVTEGETQVGPEDCRKVLDGYGITNTPFRVATSAEQAVQFAEQMGYPVVLKVVSPQILHKTDIGGVVLGVETALAVEEAYEDIESRVRRLMPAAEIDGIGVQKMAPAGRELIIGMFSDPQFGPMIMVGLGGIYVEAFNDVAFRIAPASPAEVARMLRELKAFRLLEGVRGEKPADIEAVEEVLMRVSQMAVEQPHLLEMDINPLMVYNAGAGCTCVDVRMTLGGERS